MGGVGSRVCNNILQLKQEFDVQTAGRSHLGGQGVAVLHPPSSVMSGHGGCMAQGRAGGVQAWCTQMRVNAYRCVQ